MLRTIFGALFLILAMTISGCSGQEAAGEKADYDATKNGC